MTMVFFPSAAICSMSCSCPTGNSKLRSPPSDSEAALKPTARMIASAFAAISRASFSTMVLRGAMPTRMPETEPIC